MRPADENAHKTAIYRKEPSVPARCIVEKHLPKLKFRSILDWGCGRGRDMLYYKEHGLKSRGYDPHFLPTAPRGKFDFVACTYVLNVVDRFSKRVQCVEDIKDKLKVGGHCLFTIRPHKEIRKKGEDRLVRRYDGRRKCLVDQKGWDMHADGYITTRGTFQSLMSMPYLTFLIANCGLKVIHIVDNSKIVMVLAQKV